MELTGGVARPGGPAQASTCGPWGPCPGRGNSLSACQGKNVTAWMRLGAGLLLGRTTAPTPVRATLGFQVPTALPGL